MTHKDGRLEICTVFIFHALLLFSTSGLDQNHPSPFEVYKNTLITEIGKLGNVVRGVAILVASEENGGSQSFFNQGLYKDITKMKTAFENLKFAVCDYTIHHPRNTDIKEIITAASSYDNYPDSLQYICFYYTGHGGSSDGHPFILDRNNDNLPITKEIVSPFYPENAPHLEKRIRLFFFDCCLSNVVNKDKLGQVAKEKSLLLPSKGNTLIAFATAMESVSKLGETGSYWTNILIKYLTSDKPLSNNT